ncbi:hypothetical protein SCLCIDRAFT_28315 [Scleroderma citrinum Foug A]|uniref:ATP-dependent DNA helicase n=1 Tax=Scleroderma citrinum Foug A TaxID=1036808 RepID=A0A0C3DQ88_9AGAM|nr:hypothetical protein SCLCIDRAFT_28315 [Scleroderma citrinum Foug A]
MFGDNSMEMDEDVEREMVLTMMVEEDHEQTQSKDAKVFVDEDGGWDVTKGDKVRIGTVEDFQLLEEWRRQMQNNVNIYNQGDTSGMDIPSIPNENWLAGDCGEISARVIPLSECSNNMQTTSQTLTMSFEQALSSINPSILKDDQYHVYDIVTWHLEETLARHNPCPLRVIVHGEGSTGKSKVIQTVTQEFVCRGARYMMLKSAYMGVAASLIEGKTTHTIAMIGHGNRNNLLSNETKQKLENFWRNYEYLIIDEISMISKSFFALLSQIITMAKVKRGGDVEADSFRGISVIICGDFHQFPLVAMRSSEALYFPQNLEKDSADALLGRAIYEEFTMVVILKEQIRCTDPEWYDFLHHLCFGCVQAPHVEMLRTLVLGNINAIETDFLSAPWEDASLITPHHAV